MQKKANRYNMAGENIPGTTGTQNTTGATGYFGSAREMQKMDAAGEAAAESLGAATGENKYNSSM